MATIKIRLKKSLIFECPKSKKFFVLIKGREIRLRPQKGGTFFFWKINNYRRVVRFVALELKEINEYIQQQEKSA